MIMKPTKVDVKKTADTVPDLFCPFMSGQAIPTQVAGAIAVSPQTGVVSMMNPCALEKCACFNTDFRTCCFNYLPKAIVDLNSLVNCMHDSVLEVGRHLVHLQSLERIGDRMANLTGALCNLILKRGDIPPGNLDGITAALVVLGGKFDPPLGGESPIARIADALEKLVKLTEARKVNR